MQKKKKKKRNLEFYLISYTKISSKWLTKLNVKAETVAFQKKIENL